MLVRAIINISGRFTEYDTIYWILSGLLFSLAAVLDFIARQRRLPAAGMRFQRIKTKVRV